MEQFITWYCSEPRLAMNRVVHGDGPNVTAFANQIHNGPMSLPDLPNWLKEAVDRWMIAANVSAGRIFRAVSRHGSPWGKGISENSTH
jgi:hypothetical protein